MRAETESLIEEIKQSVRPLRRHLDVESVMRRLAELNKAGAGDVTPAGNSTRARGGRATRERRHASQDSQSVLLSGIDWLDDRSRP